MTYPAVTVLINSYNYGRFLGRAIDSVLEQDYPGEIEVLVVDDGSTDDTPDVAGRYGDGVRYIWKENGGQASALNRGFCEARGDIICLLDSDDYFYPEKVRLVVEAFCARPEIGLVHNEFDIVDGHRQMLPKRRPEPTWTGCTIPLAEVPAQLQSLILLGHPWTTTTSAMSVRRSAVCDLTVPEDVFPHSPDLFLGLVLPFMTDVAIVETPVTGYVFHGENIGLFQSSARNREIYGLQMDCIRRYIEARFRRRFLTYCGRSMYGVEGEERVSGFARFSVYADECRRIVAADVAPVVKRRSQAKLAASLLLPGKSYDVAQTLRASLSRRRSRRFRQALEQANLTRTGELPS